MREHGTNATYQSGCRCDECRQAHSRTTLAYRRKGNYKRYISKRGISSESAERVDKLIALAFGERCA